MEIRRFMLDRMSITAFAEQHGLVMEVHEREYADLPRFYAHFANSDTTDGYVLSGTFGNGASEDLAIAKYAKAISGKRLVIEALSKERREIRCPQLHHEPESRP